jgi:hypothetical protein
MRPRHVEVPPSANAARTVAVTRSTRPVTPSRGAPPSRRDEEEEREEEEEEEEEEREEEEPWPHAPLTRNRVTGSVIESDRSMALPLFVIVTLPVLDSRSWSRPSGPKEDDTVAAMAAAA